MDKDDQYRNCLIKYLQHKGLIAQGSHTDNSIIDELDQKIVADPEHLVEVQKVLEQDMYLYTFGLKMKYELEEITLPDKRENFILISLTLIIVSLSFQTCQKMLCRNFLLLYLKSYFTKILIKSLQLIFHST